MPDNSCKTGSLFGRECEQIYCMELVNMSHFNKRGKIEITMKMLFIKDSKICCCSELFPGFIELFVV